MGMRFVASIFVVALVCSACAGAPGDAGCVRPGVTVSSASAKVGELVVIHGAGFFATCADTNEINSTSESVSRSGDVRINFAQGGKMIKLVDVTAVKKGSFDVVITIPADAHPGAAVIESNWPESNSATVTIVR